MSKKSLRIGACQTPEILGDVDGAVACIEKFANDAESKAVDLLLFPECFLQGYLVTKEHLEHYALELRSSDFEAVLGRLANIRPTLVLGVIERLDGKLYNSAVVVESGKFIGTYRKTHLVPGEALFEAGESYPVFTLKGLKYGVNICYDTNFTDAASPIASQGGCVLLVSAQNMMKRESAEKWKYQHNKIRAERAKETGMWLVSSDVTGQRDEDRIGYGPTAVINPAGRVVRQVPLMNTGMVIAEIEA
jgi:predicted amidohydrolase